MKTRLRKNTVNRADYYRNTRFSQVIVTETGRLGICSSYSRRLCSVRQGQRGERFRPVPYAG